MLENIRTRKAKKEKLQEGFTTQILTCQPISIIIKSICYLYQFRKGIEQNRKQNSRAKYVYKCNIL